MYGKAKPKQKEFNENDLEALLNSNLHDVEVDEDVDMNDSDLLKQLQEITSSTEVKRKAQGKTSNKKPKHIDMDIDVDAYSELAQGNDDIEVEFDENDLNDPNLLNELNSLSNSKNTTNIQHEQKAGEVTKEISELMSMGFTKIQSEKALKMYDNDLERAANYLFDLGGGGEEDDTIKENVSDNVKENEVTVNDNKGSNETEDEPTDPNFYLDKAKQYQKLALEAKKAGDKSKAVALLRQSKMFKAKYQELIEIIGVEEPHIQTEAKSTVSPAEEEKSVPVYEQERKSNTLKEPVAEYDSPIIEQTKQPTQMTQESHELLKKVVTLQKEYKDAALHYKQLGNISAAKQMVRTSKELLHTGIRLKNGEITFLESVKLPTSPDMSLGDGKIRQITEVTQQHNSLDQIESQLTYQMNICHNIAVQKNSTRKASNTRVLSDNSQNNYSKVEEAFSADIISLKAHNIIPRLHYEQVTYTYKNILDNIPENVMEFKIVKAVSLPTLDISTKLEPFVTWDFGGWPPENTAQASMNKGETPVVSGISPEFNFTLSIPISRTNRLFQRYLQRKKLSIEVFHNKYNYGFLRRPVSLGKVTIPMDRLLTKSSISGEFDLLDSRKKTGGKIEIELNLREPIKSEDIVKRSERWLVIDDFGSMTSNYLSQAGLTDGSSYVQPSKNALSPVSMKSNINDSPKQISEVSEPKKVSSPSAQTPKIASNEEDVINTNIELEAAEEEFNSVDNIVSNMVLEHEMALTNAALDSNKPIVSKEDLIDRKQALEIKMNMLVINVQSGLLDMDTYLKDVENRMIADRKLALIFKKHNRLDLAKAALVRKKIMQDEIDEAKAAMAENSEE